MPDAVIVAATRTPIGRAHKGSLADVRPDDLAAFAIRAALELVPELDPAEIDDVCVGCAMPERTQGLNIGRRAVLLAGLPSTVPASTVNRFCASSLEAVCIGFHAIAAGQADVFVAAGVESVSYVSGPAGDAGDLHPLLSRRGDGGFADVYISMGITAENVAERFGVSREDADRFAQRSHERAVAAQDSGFFASEITPLRRVDGVLVEQDDGPRRSSTIEALAALPPAFRPGGRVTAGNSCPLNDGAAAVVLLSDRKARELGIVPRARAVASAVAGIAPEIMGVGPIEAIRTVLRRAGAVIADVDVIELNEAFAAQVLAVCGAFDVDPLGDMLNPHGGAIAVGHPYGMTGARIVGALLNGLGAVDGTLGLATLCVAGGQGAALLVERLA